MTKSEFQALQALYRKLMNAYAAGDDQAAMVITYLAAAIAAAQLWRRELAAEKDAAP